MERRKSHKLNIFYKIYHGIYPEYLFHLLCFNNNSGHILRHTTTVIPRFTRLTLTQKSFFPSTTKAWNNLPTTVQNSISFTTFKALTRGPNHSNKYHNLGKGRPSIWLARIRMGLSGLNAHRFNYKFIDSPICIYCNTGSKTTHHYFFSCPTHRLARHHFATRLLNEIGLDLFNAQNYNKNLETIINGKHISPLHFEHLLEIVFEYIINTKRFF